MEFAFVFG